MRCFFYASAIFIRGYTERLIRRKFVFQKVMHRKCFFFHEFIISADGIFFHILSDNGNNKLRVIRSWKFLNRFVWEITPVSYYGGNGTHILATRKPWEGLMVRIEFFNHFWVRFERAATYSHTILVLWIAPRAPKIAQVILNFKSAKLLEVIIFCLSAL